MKIFKIFSSNTELLLRMLGPLFPWNSTDMTGNPMIAHDLGGFWRAVWWNGSEINGKEYILTGVPILFGKKWKLILNKGFGVIFN